MFLVGRSYAQQCTVYHMMPRELSKPFLALLLLLLIAADGWLVFTAPAQREARVSVIPAVAGKAAIVQAAGGRVLVVDPGQDATILRALGETLPPWARRID